MPRKARRESQTGVYHVMVRGLNKLPIFKQTREKTRIVNLIRENRSKYEVVIYAYCIMPNHFHLLIKADLKELASFMAKILAAYAKYYNYKHNRIGYVFQDRYKSQCVEEESYFWNCLRYIHMNPSSHAIPEEILKYRHSSMAEYYYMKQDIIHDEGFVMMNTRFSSSQDFLEFHKMKSRDIFVDIPEEIMENYIRIAHEILTELQWKLSMPPEEILEYVETRKKYEKELQEFFQTSNRTIQDIERTVRNGLKGTG